MRIGFGFDEYPEEYNCIATFSDAKGLEGEFLVQKDPDGVSVDLCEIILSDCDITEQEFLKRFHQGVQEYGEHIMIFIMSQSGEIHTSRYVSKMEINKTYLDSKGQTNVKVTGWIHASSMGWYEIVKQRLTSGLNGYGEWKNLPEEKVQGWLQAAINLMPEVEDVADRVVEIDSKGIDVEDKFYCALGEAIHGPGGYFGRGYHALDDCLFKGFGIKGKFTLRWKSHQVFKEKFPKLFEDICEIFDHYPQKKIEFL